LKPWLIEVNASPSLTATTPSDFATKSDVLDDTFTVIDMENFLLGTEEQIGGFDLICKGSPIKLPLNSTYKTHLGCYNNRKQQLKKLAKITSARLTQQYAQELINNGTSGKTGFRK
jgi:tubulin polyglutamylase TTLL9